MKTKIGILSKELASKHLTIKQKSQKNHAPFDV